MIFYFRANMGGGGAPLGIIPFNYGGGGEGDETPETSGTSNAIARPLVQSLARSLAGSLAETR